MAGTISVIKGDNGIPDQPWLIMRDGTTWKIIRPADLEFPYLQTGRTGCVGLCMHMYPWPGWLHQLGRGRGPAAF